jgi:hypothetical protein
MREDKELTKKVLDLLPIDGSEIPYKEWVEKGMKAGLTKITIQRKAKALVKRKLVARREETRVKVHYSRREKVRVGQLIDDFTREINETLKHLPQDKDALEIMKGEIVEDAASKREGGKRVSVTGEEGAAMKKEAREVVEKLRGKKDFNEMLSRSFVLFSIEEKVLKMLDDNLSDDKKGKYCNEIILVPCEKSIRAKLANSTTLSRSIRRIWENPSPF